MKKTLLSALIALGLLQSASLAANLDEIKKSGVLKIATEGVYKPYSYHDENDNLTGYDVEIANEVAKKIGVKAQFVEAPWDALIVAFDTGKGDIMFNQVSVLEERKKKYDFTTPYTYVHGAVITRSDDESIKAPADIKGKKTINSQSSNWAKISHELGADVITTDSFNKEIQTLLSKRVDLVISDDLVVEDFIKNNPDTKIKIAFKLEENIPSAAIIKKGNDELLKAVNKALDELIADGTIAKISQKYFGRDISKK